jgi:hypothetical protein
MSKLLAGERNLLRYYAETERILHGQSEVPLISTCSA